MNSDVLTRKEMQESYIDTSAYQYNLDPGTFKATLELKAEGHHDILRLFFAFEDGRKIIAPVYGWQGHLGFYEIPIGSKLKLLYTKSSAGTFLTGVSIE